MLTLEIIVDCSPSLLTEFLNGTADKGQAKVFCTSQTLLSTAWAGQNYLGCPFLQQGTKFFK